jgi:hypothetical protein
MPRTAILALRAALLVLAAGLIASCANFASETPGPASVNSTTQTATIEDRTGKVWDVTHARDHYGFMPEKFQFGLGPRAIRPIMNPVMLMPGELGYPPDISEFFILGTRLSDSARAYSIGHLSRHEVVNEQFGDAHVAVAY